MKGRWFTAALAAVVLFVVSGCSASSGRYFSIREPGGPEIARASSDVAPVTEVAARDEARDDAARETSTMHFRPSHDAICMQCESP